MESRPAFLLRFLSLSMNTQPSESSRIDAHIDATECRFNGTSADVPDVGEPAVHDGVYSPTDLIRHCEAMRAEIAERQKVIIDVPV